MSWVWRVVVSLLFTINMKKIRLCGCCCCVKAGRTFSCGNRKRISRTSWVCKQTLALATQFSWHEPKTLWFSLSDSSFYRTGSFSGILASSLAWCCSVQCSYYYSSNTQKVLHSETLGSYSHYPCRDTWLIREKQWWSMYGRGCLKKTKNKKNKRGKRWKEKKYTIQAFIISSVFFKSETLKTLIKETVSSKIK